jgi:hypothetical protein
VLCSPPSPPSSLFRAVPCRVCSCQSGSTCTLTNGGSSYSCECPLGYSGVRCSTNINECASRPCQNGGSCVDQLGYYYCNCSSSYSGIYCQTYYDAACDPNPCLNGGVCFGSSSASSGYTCTCSTGYRGVRCEQTINYCTSFSLSGNSNPSYSECLIYATVGQTITAASCSLKFPSAFGSGDVYYRLLMPSGYGDNPAISNDDGCGSLQPFIDRWLVNVTGYWRLRQSCLNPSSSCSGFSGYGVGNAYCDSNPYGHHHTTHHTPPLAQ